MIVNAFNLYYEIPAAGGGNMTFTNEQDAVAEAKSIVKAYPDCYVDVSSKLTHELVWHNGR